MSRHRPVVEVLAHLERRVRLHEIFLVRITWPTSVDGRASRRVSCRRVGRACECWPRAYRAPVRSNERCARHHGHREPTSSEAHPSKSREADVISRASCQKRKVGRKDGRNRPEAMAPNAWHRPTAARPTPDRDADTWTCTRTYVRGGTDRPSMVRGQADAGRRVGRSVVSPQSVSRWCHALACLWHLAHRMMLRTRALFSFSRAYDVTPPWRNSHVMP